MNSSLNSSMHFVLLVVGCFSTCAEGGGLDSGEGDGGVGAGKTPPEILTNELSMGLTEDISKNGYLLHFHSVLMGVFSG